MIQAEWAPEVILRPGRANTNTTDNDGDGEGGSDEGETCPVFVLRAAHDIVGCAGRPFEYQLPETAVALQVTALPGISLISLSP